ncbi:MULTISPECIES: hypothetical protein [Tsukamurella]|uniref:hypothetical protein n=1 Tax=Tsukamurella TaxID=2060 RepID=UPI0017876668|nr:MULTISPECIES: hypothetical protein [Tsukamurella]
MTGPEHYAEAERLLAIATEVGRAITATREDPLSPEDVRARRDELGKQATGLFARAQVHATLALAAATALPEVNQMVGSDEGADQTTRWHTSITRSAS